MVNPLSLISLKDPVMGYLLQILKKEKKMYQFIYYHNSKLASLIINADKKRDADAILNNIGLKKSFYFVEKVKN